MKQKKILQMWRIFWICISWVFGLFGIGLSGYYIFFYAFGDGQNLWIAGYALLFLVVFYELLKQLIHLHPSDKKKKRKNL
jgi:apolipoprotein N-acyltransferase